MRETKNEGVRRGSPPSFHVRRMRETYDTKVRRAFRPRLSADEAVSQKQQLEVCHQDIFVCSKATDSTDPS